MDYLRWTTGCGLTRSPGGGHTSTRHFVLGHDHKVIQPQLEQQAHIMGCMSKIQARLPLKKGLLNQVLVCERLQILWNGCISRPISFHTLICAWT